MQPNNNTLLFLDDSITKLARKIEIYKNSTSQIPEVQKTLYIKQLALYQKIAELKTHRQQVLSSRY